MIFDIKIQIASTPQDREFGYQFVKEIPDMTGMLFKFQSSNELSFWGNNTYVPLDIAFVSEEGVVINTDKIVPLSLRSVRSSEPCCLALEVPGGTFDRIGLIAGSKIDIDLDNNTVHFDDQN